MGGAIATGTLSGGLQGAFTGAIFGGIGGLGGLGEWGPGAFVAAHAVGGCITSAATGGKCGQGALAAGFAKYATLEFKYDGFAEDIVNGVKAAVAGGTASVLAGGKFESGAMTAGFAYLFNYCAHNGCFNRRFTLADAYDQWKNGNGSLVTDVGASELNFKGATWVQSSEDPKTWYASLSMQFESGPIYGTISGRVGENGLFTLNPDICDFDVKELQGRSFSGDLAIVRRNVFNAIGATIHGNGTPFQIEFSGSVRAPQPVYDRTFGTVP